MHLHTTVKVSAADEAEAIKRVNRLLSCDYEYCIAPFDWIAEDETRISEDIKVEEEFLKLRQMERLAHFENFRRAEETEDESMKGFYIRKAGECLEDRNFWSTERLQFSLDWEGGEKVFYVDTDRHY